MKCIYVKTAYLQGDRIEREVYFKPPAEANMDKVWRLKKTVYGLKDTARAWYRSVVGHIQKLRGVRSNLDPAIFM